MEENLNSGQSGASPISIDQVANRCMDAPGYVLFAAILTPEIDSNGFNVIQMTYHRSNFSFEDTKKAIEAFIAHYNKDSGF